MKQTSCFSSEFLSQSIPVALTVHVVFATDIVHVALPVLKDNQWVHSYSVVCYTVPVTVSYNRSGQESP